MGERKVSKRGSKTEDQHFILFKTSPVRAKLLLCKELRCCNERLESWKSSLAAKKQPLSDIFSFLTNTHPPAGLGDTWRPEQAVTTYHYKTSIFWKYNLCSTQCFPWKTALLRAIKKVVRIDEVSPCSWTNNHVRNVEVSNDGGMLNQNP